MLTLQKLFLIYWWGVCMKCDELMEEYLHIERYERLPLHMAFHLLHCKKCRDNIRNMTLATHFSYNKIMQRPTKTNTLYIRTMQQIMATSTKKVIKKSNFTFLILTLWSIIGTTMLAIFLVVPSTKIGIKAIQAFGSRFTLQFLFTVVSFLTICTIIFIANNLRFLVKTFRLATSKA